ncbi:MAG TPA: lipoyl(octanoyl) transferase LipB [Acidocella sp.]|nr:MAG: lipoate-protein ligase B [Rhodospirillales bacterium 20-64-7]HQT47671.1 lipoyl(octanoyl) transferase LipB [Acidocella sp.]
MTEAAATWRVEPGLTEYEPAVAAMRARVEAIRQGEADELVWLVEHPPLYTAGTSARPEDLQAAGRFPSFAAGRGGQWTYHGPGQRVVYLMLDLNRAHGQVKPRDIRGYVAGLEAWMIATLAEFGVRGEIREGRVGIWVVNGEAEQKVGAIGVRVTKWVSWHGIALNVAPALEHFSGIVPCGIREHGVTSMAALGVAASMAKVDAALQRQFRKFFG